MAFLNQPIRGRWGVTGVAGILQNLKERQKDLGDRVPGVLTRAALMLMRESQRVVPVEYGNLKASATTPHYGSGWKFQISVAYLAPYALVVHELVGMKLRGKPRPSGIGAYWDPRGRGQAKFLEEPARRLRPQLLKLVRDGMKI